MYKCIRLYCHKISTILLVEDVNKAPNGQMLRVGYLKKIIRAAFSTTVYSCSKDQCYDLMCGKFICFVQYNIASSCK